MNTISKVYNKDCNIELRKFENNYFDYAIVDTNWGIQETKIKPESRNTPIIQSNGSKTKIKAKDYSTSNWDLERPSKEYFGELFRVSKIQFIKGGNYFTDLLPEFSGGRIIWDKVNGTNDFSDCEIIWTNAFKSVRLFSYMWNGMMQGVSLLEPKKQQGNKELNEKRIHRNQTPVKFYDFIYSNYIPKGSKILDTHLGSGSNRIAAYKNECDFIGFEIDKKAFDSQEKRWREELPNLDSAIQFLKKCNTEAVQISILDY